MANFWRLVNKVIAKADVILEVIDARMVEETRNAEVESKVKGEGKPLIYVVNKCDLVNIEGLRKKIQHLNPCVFVSTTKHHGFTMLKDRILIEAHKRNIKKPRVGVLGYPNVGKSSVINTLKGSSAAKTSPESGFTRSLQNVRVGSSIMMIDTPGVFPYLENNKAAHVLTGVIDSGKAKDPDAAAMRIMEEHPGSVEGYFGVGAHDDGEITLGEIALKKGLLLKGGKPDIDRAARNILRLWQKGEIKEQALVLSKVNQRITFFRRKESQKPSR
ncbi:50S ribosome-binding GTPase [Candidatus Woesearchaeota archaeon]|nr:50S ribosome-binding GTPase [Candidatus Woesearchaeota archaeon]